MLFKRLVINLLKISTYLLFYGFVIFLSVRLGADLTVSFMKENNTIHTSLLGIRKHYKYFFYDIDSVWWKEFLKKRILDFKDKKYVPDINLLIKNLIYYKAETRPYIMQYRTMLLKSDVTGEFIPLDIYLQEALIFMKSLENVLSVGGTEFNDKTKWDLIICFLEHISPEKIEAAKKNFEGSFKYFCLAYIFKHECLRNELKLTELPKFPLVMEILKTIPEYTNWAPLVIFKKAYPMYSWEEIWNFYKCLQNVKKTINLSPLNIHFQNLEVMSLELQNRFLITKLDNNLTTDQKLFIIMTYYIEHNWSSLITFDTFIKSLIFLDFDYYSLQKIYNSEPYLTLNGLQDRFNFYNNFYKKSKNIANISFVDFLCGYDENYKKFLMEYYKLKKK